MEQPLQDSDSDYNEDGILSRNNLSLCKATYFETCWCKLNSTETVVCPYLLHYVNSYSNSSYFCVYHNIRKFIDCFNSTVVFPKTESVSTLYIYVTICIFTVGFIGNGFSAIVLLDKRLRHLGIYRNLAILCIFNILYLLAISIRHINTYNKDIRNISVNLCRAHIFIVAFTGHLCSWQLVSTSIQRVHALIRLRPSSTTSWARTLGVLFTVIILPLLVLDGQILFNYGLLRHNHICDTSTTTNSAQFQRALIFPMNESKLMKNILTLYHENFNPSSATETTACRVCIQWNMIDTLVYAIIPFVILLATSIVIIGTMFDRRRSMASFGGVLHTSQSSSTSHNSLSRLLIAINCLFLIMTGPLNVCFILQPISKHFSSNVLLMKFLLKLNEYLRLLQNSYHALSFIFYCVVGNKFRSTAWSLCETVYSKLTQFIRGERTSRDSTTTLRCTKQKQIESARRTTSTSLNSENRQQDATVLVPLVTEQGFLVDDAILTNRQSSQTLV